jgi:hypothetical protein
MAVAPLSTSQAPSSQPALAQVAPAGVAPAGAAPAQAAASPARPETWRLGAPQGESAPLHPHAADAVASYDEGLTFWDFLDLVNPLQHIPGVAQVYRAVTGDQIKAPIQIAGGALLGGPIGLVAAVAGAAVQESSGKDIGGHVLAWFGGEGEAPPEMGATGTMVADAASGPAPGPAPAPSSAAPRAAEAAVVPGSSASVAAAPAPAPATVELASAAPAPAPTAGAARAFAAPPRPGEAQPRAFPVPARLSGTAAAHPMRHPAPAPRDVAHQVAEAAGADARGGAPSSASPAAPTPAAAIPAAPASAAPASAAQAAAWPPGGPAALPRELIADAMMGALDKYQRSARLGTRQAPSAGLPPS